MPPIADLPANLPVDPVATLIADPSSGALATDLADRISNLLGAPAPDWLAPPTACDIPIAQGNSVTVASAAIAREIADRPIDVVIQSAANRTKRALIADMDSTMIDQECIDELANKAGFGAQVAAITARAMNGEIEFEGALRERVGLLAGLPVAIIEQLLAERITIAAGARVLIATMRANGAYCALVSGGFTRFAAPIAARIGFNEHSANVLEEREGLLTGTVRDPIFGRDAKVEALRRICRERNLTPADFIAVGDGANDLDMLAFVGTGVALHARPAVAAAAKVRIDHGDLTALLYLQGYRQSEFAQ